MSPAAALALALAGGAGATALRARAREGRLARRFPPQGKFVSVEGHQMHAVVAGNGPDLVLIHGLSSSLREFTYGLIDALSPRYRVYAIDRPGKGWSDWPADGWRLETQARLVRGAALALGASRPVVLGHSYGGSVALAWAVHWPESMAALVPLSAPSHVRPDRLGLYYQMISHPLLAWAGVPLISAWAPDWAVGRAVRDTFAPQLPPEDYMPRAGPELTLRRETLAANGACRRHLLAEIAHQQPHYTGLSMPVEILHGDADTIVPAPLHAEALAREVPGAALTLMPGMGHMPHITAPEEVIAAIDRAHGRAETRAHTRTQARTQGTDAPGLRPRPGAL